VDQLVGVGAVLRVAGDADRDRGVDRLTRRLDVEALLRHGLADPLGNLERLLRRRLREQDRELLAAEAGGHVVVAQLRAEDLGDALQHRVAGEVAVRVVDVAEQVEVGHDQRHRPAEPLCPTELLCKRRREVARVEEARLRIDAGLGLQGGNAQRAVDQEERGENERDHPCVRVPEGGHRDAESGEHDLRRQVLEREEPGVPGAVTTCEPEHPGEQAVVERDVHERGGGAREREQQLPVLDDVAVADHAGDPPRRHDVDRVVADVERLQVPAVAVLEPFRDHRDRAERRDELRREQEHGGDEEDDVRVVGLIVGRADAEKPGGGGAGGEDREGQPTVRSLQTRQQREAGGGGDDGRGGEVNARRNGEPLAARGARRPCSDVAGNGAHPTDSPSDRRAGSIPSIRGGLYARSCVWSSPDLGT
jgi:hypothetical protein